MDVRETIAKLQAKADDRSVEEPERRIIIDKINELKRKYQIVDEEPPPEPKPKTERRWTDEDFRDTEANITYADIHRWRHRNPNVGSTGSAHGPERGPDFDSLIEEVFKYSNYGDDDG